MNKAEEEKLTPTGKAKEALEMYLERFKELEREGRDKPDMIACKELRKKGIQPQRKHGELEGVPIGLVVRSRGEACILGIHHGILNGIDALKDEPCYAVCMSGGYADDDYRRDGSILYTGEGGQNTKKSKSRIRPRTVEMQR
jgi:SAD/SRA domain